MKVPLVLLALALSGLRGSAAGAGPDAALLRHTVAAATPLATATVPGPGLAGEAGEGFAPSASFSLFTYVGIFGTVAALALLMSGRTRRD